MVHGMSDEGNKHANAGTEGSAASPHQALQCVGQVVEQQAPEDDRHLGCHLIHPAGEDGLTTPTARAQNSHRMIFVIGTAQSQTECTHSTQDAAHTVWAGFLQLGQHVPAMQPNRTVLGLMPSSGRPNTPWKSCVLISWC